MESLQGGITLHFVTNGIESAVEQPRNQDLSHVRYRFARYTVHVA
jgi:hypothetical protein